MPVDPLTLASLALAATVAAQSAPPDPDAPADEEMIELDAEEGDADLLDRELDAAETPAFSLAFDAEQRYLFSADIDDNDGDVDVYRTSAGLSGRARLDDKLTLSFSLEGDVSIYDFDDAAGFARLPDDEPFEDPFWNISAFLLARYQVREDFAIVGALRGASAFESGADFGDTLSGGAIAGVAFPAARDFDLTLGVALFGRLEDDPIVIPYIAFDWQIDDTLNLRSDGRGAQLTKSLSQDFDVFFRGGYYYRQWRLDDDGQRQSSGVFRDQGLALSLGFTWTPDPNLAIELSGGATFLRELEVLDSGGESLNAHDVDPTPFVTAKLTYRF